MQIQSGEEGEADHALTLSLCRVMIVHVQRETEREPGEGADQRMREKMRERERRKWLFRGCVAHFSLSVLFPSTGFILVCGTRTRREKRRCETKFGSRTIDPVLLFHLHLQCHHHQHHLHLLPLLPIHLPPLGRLC